MQNNAARGLAVLNGGSALLVQVTLQGIGAAGGAAIS